ncbi:MAG: 3-oxoacyl-[acyl-carrier-protein] reductase [Alphaproteobacteria bacterium]|nr:MAG: 3-oxoacyl-[acyl-carrier-protein] reductase [Alphaproteobacteria bacterium]
MEYRFDLGGRRALVTGASGGIGRAIAAALHSAGATVALSGTRRGVLEELAGELGERVVVTPADLSDREAVEALPQAAAEALGGPIDILVNNAGLTRDQLLLRMKDDDWARVLTVNLEAAFRLTRACLKPMMRARFGRIVNISSVVGITGNAGQANYAASKAGLIGFTKSVAQEVASRGITVNAIAPGFIRSPMTDALDDRQREALLGRIPAGRFGEPEDVAAAVLYLAGETGAYVTGQTLHVNGGMAMI